MPILARILPPTTGRRALIGTPCLPQGATSRTSNPPSHAIIPLRTPSSTTTRSVSNRAATRHRHGSFHSHSGLTAIRHSHPTEDSLFTSLHNVFRSILERRHFHAVNARQANCTLPTRRSLHPRILFTGKDRGFCRDCNVAFVQSSRRRSPGLPLPSSFHTRTIHSQAFQYERHQHDLIQDDSPYFAPIQPNKNVSAPQSPISLKDKAQNALDLYRRKDFSATVRACRDLETSIRQQKSKPSTLEYRIVELEMFQYCAGIEQWATAQQSLEEASGALRPVIPLDTPTRGLSAVAPLKATLHPQYQHNTSLLFEAEGDPIITRAFELLVGRLLNRESDNQAAQLLMQLIDRSIALQLLPDRSSTFPPHSPRVRVLDFLFAQREADRAMAWVWLWDRIDAVDWRQQVVSDQQRASLRQRFADVGREDFVLDVSRMLNKSYMPLTGAGSHQGGHGRRKTAIRLFSPESVTSCFEVARNHPQPLYELLRIYQLDKDRFASKSFLYGNIQEGMRMDLISSWTEGVLSQRSLKSRIVRARPDVAESPESLLWREMAMVGMLSSELVVEDIMRVTGISRQGSLKTIKDGIGCGEELYQDSLVLFLKNLPKTEPISLLRQAIQETMSYVHTSNSANKTDDYRMLLQELVHQVATRLHHRGLISQTLELKFRAACDQDDALLARVESAVRRWKTAHVGGYVAEQAKHHQHYQQQRSNVSSSTQVQSFLTNVVEPTLARMCAIVAVQPKPVAANIGDNLLPSASSSDFFSEWLTTMSEWSPRTGPMLRFLDSPGKRLLPTTTAYRAALHTLLQEGELDMAVALHLCAYDLIGRSADPSSEKKQHHFPSTKELGQLVDRLTQEQSAHHIEKAQWIINQHLWRERKRQALSIRTHHDVHKHTSRFLDTAIISSLVRGWLTQGAFGKVQEQVDLMRRYGLLPNKYFYSIFFKALVDLEPTTQNRQLVGGGDGQARQIGRRIAVQHMLETRYLEEHVHDRSRTAASLHIPSALDDAWKILFQVIREQEAQYADDLLHAGHSASSSGWSSTDSSGFPGKDLQLGGSWGTEASLSGLDKMKNLVHQMVRATMADNDSRLVQANAPDNVSSSRFQPNLHIFSILLDAYSRRGNTEAILDILSDMSKLGLEPNEVVYTTLANAFAKRRNMRAMDQVIREADQSGVDTGLYMYNIALNALIGMNASPDKIHDFVQQMVRMAEKEADEVLGIADPAAASPHSLLSSSRQAASRSDTNRHLLSSPFQGLDQVTLSTLVNYHAKRRDMDSAEQVLRAMTSTGFVPDKGVYYLILGAYLQQHRTLAGLDLLRSMRTHARCVPDARAWKGLLACAMEEQKQLDRKHERIRQQNRRSAYTPGAHKLRRDRHNQQEQPNTLTEVKEAESATAANTNTARKTTPLSTSVIGGSHNSLVTQVLQELWVTVDHLKAHDANRPFAGTENLPWALRKGYKSPWEQYVREIFASSSWITLSQAEVEELAAWMQGNSSDSIIVSKNSKSRRLTRTSETMELNDGKGRHGLLRRILDHLLQEARHSFAAKQDAEQRCFEALQVIQQVEKHGLLLGDKWKWLVVGSHVEQLVNWSPEQIQKLLERPIESHK